jgi:hypothetical protein
LAKTAGGNAKDAPEGACEGFLRVEAAVERQVDESHIRIPNQPVGCSHQTSATDIRHDAPAHPRSEEPREMIGRKPSLIGDVVQLQGIVEMTLDPLDEWKEIINATGVWLIHALIVAHLVAAVLTDLATGYGWRRSSKARANEWG